MNVTPPPRDAASPQGGLAAVITLPRFRSLWLGQLLSQVADKVLLVMLLTWITSDLGITEERQVAIWSAYVLRAFALPALIFGLPAGVLVDRFRKIRVMVITLLFRAGAVALLPLAIWLPPGADGSHHAGLALLLLLTFCESTATQFFAPADQAVIPLAVDRHLLVSANALYMQTLTGSVLIGFAVGAPLLATINHLAGGHSRWAGTVAAVVIMLVYGLSALLLCRAGVQEPAPDRHTRVFHDIRDGFRAVVSSAVVLRSMVRLVLAAASLAVLVALAQPLALSAEPAFSFAWLITACGVGSIPATLLLGNSPGRSARSRVFLLGLTLMVAAMVAMALLPRTPLLLLPALLMGFGAGLVLIPAFTLIQAALDDTQRGKVFGVMNFLINVAVPIPLVLIPWLLGFGLPVAQVLILLAGLLLVVEFLLPGLCEWLVWRFVR